MPLPDKMGYTLTPAQIQAINDALDVVLATLNGIKVVQLTPEERQGAQSVSEKRFPYVQNAIENLAPQFPNLQSMDLPIADAEANLETALLIRTLMTKINEVNDRYIDFSMASEHFAYEYMLEFYENAKRAQKRNTPGADTVVNALKPLFEDQGGENPTPPTP